MENKLVKNVKREEFITKTILKERGWNDFLINKYLKKPDKEVINPHYKCAPPMKLYLLKKVKLKEKNKGFIDYIEKNKIKRENLKNGRLKAKETKTKKLLDYVNGIVIDIPTMQKQNLYNKAIRHYNNLWNNRGQYDKIIYQNAESLDDDFLNRITINMLRHECTNYEEELYNIFGRVGINERYNLLKDKVNNKILEVYPFLN